MQLKTLLTSTPVRQVFGSVDRPVENIAYGSRRVQRRSMFVALRGEKTDGHEFIGHAIDKGASVIVAEREQKDPRVTSLVVENTRTALADFSATFYGHPARKLKLAAVTGTNGKTTTTFLIKHICERAGLRCGLLGTERYEIGERILPAIRTTPESLDLQELLAQIANAGCKAAAMEVSSHALAQDRTHGLEWNVAVFTNLTQAHLDFHGTMQNYFEANALGINLRNAVFSLAKSPQVPGRLEMVPARRQFQVFVDYAHTPDALGNVLKTLRELEPERLIAVFGCGGDRDRQKRPLMAEMADRLADYSIITSDNPRKEDPGAIIAEVEKGFRSNRYEKIVDRTQAIDRAVALARPRDIVLIAGKGHENYQEFGDYTIPFDDIQVARRAIEDHPVEF